MIPTWSCSSYTDINKIYVIKSLASWMVHKVYLVSPLHLVYLTGAFEIHYDMRATMYIKYFQKVFKDVCRYSDNSSRFRTGCGLFLQALDRSRLHREISQYNFGVVTWPGMTRPFLPLR